MLWKGLTYGSLSTFVCWIGISSCALIFNAGWGLGSGWSTGLIGLAIGITCGVGLGSSFVIWAKGGVILR